MGNCPEDRLAKSVLSSMPPLGVQPLQHQLDGVDVGVGEVLVGAEEVLQEGRMGKEKI